MEKLLEELDKKDINYVVTDEKDIDSILTEGIEPLIVTLARKDLAAILDIFLELGPKVIDARNASNDTALSWSSYNGNYEITEKLLLAGADPNLICCSRRPILNWVCARARSSVINLLIAHGADTEIRDIEGKTALFAAVVHCPKCVKILLENDADVNAVDNFGHIPLMFVNNISIARKLLNYGSKVNWRNHANQTPIMFAAMLSSELVTIYVEYGADINAKCNRGHNAAFYAVLNGRSGIAELLIGEPQFDVTARDAKNNTLLHVAFEFNVTSIILDLIDRVNLLAVNTSGESILDAALQKSDMEVIYYLLQKDIRLIDVSNYGSVVVERKFRTILNIMRELKEYRKKNFAMEIEAKMLETEINSGRGGPEFVKAKNEFNKLRSKFS